MATPRQRRKARSSTHTGPSARSKKVMQKRLVRVPELKGADVLKQHWDPKKTLRQNYEKLGLVADLRLHDAGGDGRKKRGDGAMPKGERPADAFPKSKKGALGSTMARIVRDEEGNVVEVIEDRPRRAQTVWGQALNSDDEEEEGEEEQEEENEEEDADEDEDEDEDREEEGEVVKKLQALSDAKAPVPRFTSVAERTWLQRLVDRYGDDIEGMAHDKRDNVWQKTAGDIKKA